MLTATHQARVSTMLLLAFSWSYYLSINLNILLLKNCLKVIFLNIKTYTDTHRFKTVCQVISYTCFSLDPNTKQRRVVWMSTCVAVPTTFLGSKGPQQSVNTEPLRPLCRDPSQNLSDATRQHLPRTVVKTYFYNLVFHPETEDNWTFYAYYRC